MSTVNILCPNGRKQQIRVEPNTKIIQIIEQVCQKLGLNSDEYDLIHQRRRLDVTITFRLSGISNNASLELKKLVEPRQLTDVVIILQLDDGTRLKQQTFKPNDSLLKVIDEFQSNTDGLLSTLEISMNENCQPICSYLNEELIGRFQLENTTLKEFGLTSGRAILRFSYKNIDKDHFDRINNNFKKKLDKKKQIEEKTTKTKEIEEMRRENKLDEPELSSTGLDESMHPKRQKNDEKSSFINDNQTLTDEEKCAAFSEIPQLNNEFFNFKFPEETRGRDLNNDNELAEIEYKSKQPCPRQELVFLARNNSSEATSLTELQDDFYDVTINDLKFMMSELERKASEEKLLMTKAMRELEQDKKAMKYENIAIRIKFNNTEYVLQGLFKPKEPVSRLYEFVESNIQNKNADFYLYTTPPKTILSDKKKTFFDYKLYPAAIIYFGDKSKSSPILNEDLIKNIKSAEEADEIVQKNVHQKIRNINHEGIEWLEKENRTIQNVLASSRIMIGNNSFVNQEFKNTQNSEKITKMNDSNREKFERFLKGSKK